MDFSSPHRALESLGRRKPAIEGMALLSSEMMGGIGTIEYVNGCLSLLQTEQQQQQQQRWEPLAVGIYLATNLLLQSGSATAASAIYVDGPRVPDNTPSSTDTSTDTSTSIGEGDSPFKRRLSHEQLMKLSQALLQASKCHLEHSEPRVRTLVAKAVGAVISLKEESLFQDTKQLHDSILKSLYSHLEKGRDEQTDGKDYSKSSTGALDDTTGWRALETNWQGIAAYVNASPDYFKHFTLSDQLLEACEYSCITHVNRHVRAAGIQVLEQWINSCKAHESEMILDPKSPLRCTIVKVLKVTLADNWSQVRMAASVLCRAFFKALWEHPYEDRHVETLYPTLIPRMCLNRFYLAQGVKLYSHDTWLILFQAGGGVDAVANNAGAVVRYYVQMCDADNHVVREGACQAVAELATKLGSSTKEHAQKLKPFVQTLLQALLMCFHDESWPVRDEACLACGRFCRAYPQECLAELPLLKERWLEQLTDQIWSVREDAAVALGDAVLAYPDLQPELLEFIQKTLPSAKDQPPMTREAFKKHQNDIDAHTEQQLYSCGSLAPKLRKGGAGRIGCGNCGVNRPKAPWEATDGCIFLIRELLEASVQAQSTLSDEILLPLMQEMADVCRVKHFPQSDDMRTTLFRQLPVMANAIGKQRFKRLYLQIFMDILMNTMDSRTESALSQHAAGQCAEELGKLVSPMIFRGRLDDYQQQVYDRVMRERQEMPRNMEHFTSPFGPPMPGAGGTESPFGPPSGVHPGIADMHHGVMGGVSGNAFSETF